MHRRKPILRYMLRDWLGRYPSLFFPAIKLFGSTWARERVVSHNTELVIEGFPRSGNTFAVVAFELAQGRPVRLAHHQHVPAQIIGGVRKRIPVLVLIRNPVDAVLSLLVLSPWLTVEYALRSYYLFHQATLPYVDGFVIAPFADVTADFGAIIGRLNDKFGTDYRTFEHSKENLDTCFQIIEARARRFSGTDDVSTVVASPTAEKDRLKVRLRDSLEARQNQGLLNACSQLYQQFLSLGSHH